MILCTRAFIPGPGEIRLEAYHGNAGGYYDFHVSFLFNEDGSFNSAGVRE